MVALIKAETITTRGSRRPTCKGRLPEVQPARALPQARPPFRTEPENEEGLPNANGMPMPGQLPMEEANPKGEAEARSRAAAEAEAAAPVLEPQGREHSSCDGGTTFKLYLREIGRVKPLTPKEEVELAARIKKGDKKARDRMIKANLRLVVRIARDYESIGLPLLDLISEGNIGLIKAVERFDPAKGGKLSTYGSWWIKQAIKRALANQSKMIRLPIHQAD
jgi:DNA-directed RNA polymerase sigma subunit (sigma70/sigma32)